MALHSGIRPGVKSTLLWVKAQLGSLKGDYPTNSSSLDHAARYKKERGEASDLLLEDYLDKPTISSSKARCGAFHLFKRTIPRLHFLLPTFLHSKFYEPKKLRSTAWLDGLRGVAAFFVVIHHASLLWFSWEIHKGWGAKSKANSWIAILLRLPILRLVISGLPHVSIFFVISGYAISHKPLSLAHQGRYSEASSALSSSIFRRHARLHMPAMAITFCTAVMAQQQFWYSDSALNSAIPSRVVPMKNTLSEQLWTWVNVELMHTRPLQQGLAYAADSAVFHNPYDYNLWTLPIEFVSSMVIFLILAAFTRLHSRARMTFLLMATIYVEYYFVLWAIFLFLSGTLICDLRLELDRLAACPLSPHQAPRESPGTSRDAANMSVLPLWARKRHGDVKFAPIAKRVFHRSTIECIFGIVVFPIALWLLSTPDADMGAKQSWSYARMSSSVTKVYDDHLFVPMGAALLVLAIDHAKFLQRLFTNRLAQYLGRISYSLYLIHGPLLWSLAISIGRPILNDVTGMTTPWRYCAGVFLTMCLWMMIVICVADLANRYIDEQCVRFGKWFYNKLTKKEA